VTLLSGAEARIGAIMWGGRGVDGSLGGLAQSLSIPNTPTPRFRASLQNMDLTHPDYPAGAFDRSAMFDWREGGPGFNPENAYDPRKMRTFAFDLVVGYVYGDAIRPFVSLAPGTAEAAATAARYVKRRALEDADRLALAIGFTGLFQQSGDDPVLKSCIREQRSAIRDLGGGKLICTSPYVLSLDRATATTYDP
jgi:hypothetical protein